MLPKPNLQSPIVAIMQPYLFPYIGYFQLMALVDVFVVFDDVQYIRRGWINRNRILVNGKAQWFTIPVKKMPRDALINQGQFLIDDRVRNKILRTLETHYKKAPFFKVTFHLVEETLNYQNTAIVPFLLHHFELIKNYLNIKTPLKLSSHLDYNRGANAQEKIIQISKILQAKMYVNPIGGKDLYSSQTFQAEGIQLLFLNPQVEPYFQGKEPFVPNLSIIDVMMWNDVKEIQRLLTQYELIQ